MPVFEIVLGMSFVATYLVAVMIDGYDGFAKSVYATFLFSISYMIFKKEMTICSYLLDCSEKGKATLVDSLFWFFIFLAIVFLVSILFKKKENY